MTIAPENLPDDIAALQAALAAERQARQQAEARASSAEALIAHYKWAPPITAFMPREGVFWGAADRVSLAIGV